MAFDPYTNVEVMELLKHQTQTDELTQEMLKSYYKLPVMCTETDEDIARYSVLHGNEQLFAIKYKLYLSS